MIDDLPELLGITGPEAAAVVLATIGMYIALVLLVRLLGQRVLSSMSSYDLAAVIAFGGVVARAALGESPRLAGGCIALVTLVALQAVSGAVRRTRWGSRLVANRPVLLMAGDRIIDRHLARCHVTRAELMSRLRLAGVAGPGQVAAVVFEPAGTMSVLRAGPPLDPAYFAEVVGAELLGLRDRGSDESAGALS